MTAKIAVALLTFVINVAVGIAVFFLLLVGMNGYSESDATSGLVTYIVSALLVSILMAVAAFVTAGMLVRRQFGSFIAALIAIVSFVVVGVILKALCALVAVGVAEAVRMNF